MDIKSTDTTPVIRISCIDGDENVISEVSINTKYFNSQRPDVLEAALNRMVDKINESPTSLVGKAFRVKESRISPII